MSDVYMLVGPPGSGKSTWRQTHLPDTPVVSRDFYIEDFASRNGLSYREAFAVIDQKRVDQQFQGRFHRFRKARDQGFVIDRTNLTIASRAWLLRHLTDRRVLAVCLTGEHQPTKAIPPRVLQQMRRSLQPPSLSEGFAEVILA